MAIVNEVEVGSRNSEGTWTPFSWDEPKYGPQTKGEVRVIRSGGTGGNLSAGLWRSTPDLERKADGTVDLDYSSPLGDETVVILEGIVDITVKATGKKYRVEAGSMYSHPKDLDLIWSIQTPFVKKFWVIFDSPGSPETKGTDLYVGNISDNPEKWTPYSWEEPEDGTQTCGELFMLRETGTTGTLMCGLWRTGVNIAGCNPDGSSTVPYTAPLGDETMLLLEGQAELVEKESGKVHNFKAGDVIALPSGVKSTWTSKPPYVKKFWVITSPNTLPN